MMTEDGHYIDDPMDVVNAKPNNLEKIQNINEYLNEYGNEGSE